MGDAARYDERRREPGFRRSRASETPTPDFRRARAGLEIPPQALTKDGPAAPPARARTSSDTNHGPIMAFRPRRRRDPSTWSSLGPPTPGQRGPRVNADFHLHKGRLRSR